MRPPLTTVSTAFVSSFRRTVVPSPVALESAFLFPTEGAGTLQPRPTAWGSGHPARPTSLKGQDTDISSRCFRTTTSNDMYGHAKVARVAHGLAPFQGFGGYWPAVPGRCPGLMSCCAFGALQCHANVRMFRTKGAATLQPGNWITPICIGEIRKIRGSRP